MKIHIRFEGSNPTHTRMTFFLDGKNCGRLCVGTEDVVTLSMILRNGISRNMDTYVESGKVYDGKEAPCEES